MGGSTGTWIQAWSRISWSVPKSLSAAIGCGRIRSQMKWVSSNNLPNGPLSSRLKNYAEQGFGWSYLLFLVSLKANGCHDWWLGVRATSRRIVQLLKEAGASEVHVAIGSPALAYPCFYGIDIQTSGADCGQSYGRGNSPNHWCG